MHILATAGHVDHGKSTLVRALTGMEPDRWAEERRRGMTIDLGYAWTELGDEHLAFVDVPGHERFIANMLAGLGPAPGVLFVVAADEGWRRQSTEHLAAIDALDLRHGLLAVTRSDLADPARARAEALEKVAASSLCAIEAVAVSPVAGTGLDELRGALGRLVDRLPAPDPHARVRLWIDRSFTVRGSGTVVTGTLAAGTLRVGDALSVDGREVSVRGLQSLNEPHEEVRAVARVAINLRGVAVTDVARGAVLLGGGDWHHTRVVDVRLGPAAELPTELMLHLGTATHPVRVRPLGERHARLVLPVDLPVLAGDRGVLRDPGRHAVAAGFVVLDADPPAFARRGAARRRAVDLAQAGDVPDPAAELARRGAVRREHFARLGIPVDPGTRDVAGWLVTAQTWQDWVARAPVAVTDWRTAHPLEPGLPTGALVRTLGLPDPAVLVAVLADTELRVTAGRVAGAPTDGLGPAEDAVRELERRFATEPFAAPEHAELAAARLGRRELAAAERAGRLLRITDDIVLPPDAPERAVRVLAGLPQPFTTSAARQALGTTRRVAIPLLEYLDRAGHTERVDGQTRRVRAGS